MAITTQLEVANLALSKIGAKRITDLNAGSVEAQSCKLHLATVIDDLLRRHHWNFAIARNRLASATFAPWLTGTAYVIGNTVSLGGFLYQATANHTAGALNEPDQGANWASFWSKGAETEWAYGYPMPSGCVRFMRIVGPGVDLPERDFAIEGRTILLNCDNPTVVYVSNAAAIADWDPLFREAVVYALAAAIAEDITQSPSIANDLLGKLQQLALPEAKIADTREVRSGENFGTVQMIRQSGLVAARYRSDGMPPV